MRAAGICFIIEREITIIMIKCHTSCINFSRLLAARFFPPFIAATPALERERLQQVAIASPMPRVCVLFRFAAFLQRIFHRRADFFPLASCAPRKRRKNIAWKSSKKLEGNQLTRLNYENDGSEPSRKLPRFLLINFQESFCSFLTLKFISCMKTA
jgi:hypothetical protein